MATDATSAILKGHQAKFNQLNNYETILADDLRIAKKRELSLSTDDPDLDLVDLGVLKVVKKRPRLGPILTKRFGRS